MAPCIEKREGEEGIPVTFLFKHDGTSVQLIGSFTNWETRLEMIKDTNSTFTYTLSLPVGIHSFKYIADGVWQCSATEQVVTDSEGNQNNYVSVTRSHDPTKITVPNQWKENDSPPPIYVKSYQTVLYNQLLLPGVQSGPSLEHTLANQIISYEHKLLIITVGLPGRGKSYISQKLTDYLNWLGYQTKGYNVAEYRRSQIGSFYSHDWYRSDNVRAEALRTKLKLELLDQIFDFYRDGGNVAVLDGTNSTNSSRGALLQYIKAQKPQLIIKPIFLEVICDNDYMLQENILSMVASPDYKSLPPEKAIADFLHKVSHIDSVYEPVEDKHRYIRMFNTDYPSAVMNRITGFLPSKVMFYVSNLQPRPNPIFFVRHGQSKYNETEQIGGDTELTERGLEFSRRLKDFVSEHIPDASSNLCVWSSTLRRAIQTSEHIKCVHHVRWKSLEEISAGLCDGMTYEEIKLKMPDEYNSRAQDKLRYRYPRGESYEDLIQRLEPVIIELERRSTPVLVVGHQAVLRCLYAYFAQKPDREQVPFIDFPSHCIVKLQPGPYGATEERFHLD